jgi:nucleoid DNA-binding protein
MVKNDMIKLVASEAEVTNKVAETIIDAYGKFVLEVLNENRDEKVPLPGIGTFSVKHVAERSGVAALAGGKEWTKPAHDELKFTISKSVKGL